MASEPITSPMTPLCFLAISPFPLPPYRSTVVDSCSGFSGAEAPGSPAEVAARHAAGAVAAAAGGGISSSSSGGGESSGGSSNSGQHQSRQQQQQQAKQEGNFKGRIPKFKLTTGRSSTSDTPVKRSPSAATST